MTTSFPITRSVPDAEALGHIIADHYALERTLWCGLASRNMTDVYQVRAGSDLYAARVWRHEFQTEEEILYQMEFLAHLEESGVSAVSPVRLKDGSLYFTIDAPEGRRCIGLFKWADGDLMGLDPKHENFHRAGELIGLMHKAGETFVAPCDRAFDLAGRIRAGFPALQSMIANQPKAAAFYQEAVSAVCAQLDALKEQDIPMGTCHGDIHALNVNVGTDGTVTLFDFDVCSRDWLAHDVVCFEWANGRSTRGQAYADSFIAGYETVRTLTTGEQANWLLLRAAHELFYMTVVPHILNATGFAHMNYKGFDAADISARKSLSQAQIM